MYTGGGIIGLLIRKAIEVISDKLIKSPLEKDFGEAKEEDIILPTAQSIYSGETDALSIYLKRMFPMIDGLKDESLTRVLQRLIELKRNRPATYQFQVKDSGVPVELQMVFTRQENRHVEIDFRSSEAVIALIQLAFKES